EGKGLDQYPTYNATVAGSVTFGTGEAGQGFIFNGNAGCAASISNSADFQLQDFTVEAWIQRASSSITSHSTGGAQLFSWGGGGYGFEVDNDGHAYVVKNDASSIGSSFQLTDTA